MAWTATALFLAAGGAFHSAMPRIAVENQCATTVSAVLAFLAIAGFVIMQFDRRWRAADITSGLRAALTKVYKGDTLDSGMSIDDPYGFPNFVAQEKTAAGELKPRWCKSFYKDRRWWSEIASYMLLVLALVSVLVALWNPPQGENRKSEIMAADLGV